MMALHSEDNCRIRNVTDAFTGHFKSSDCNVNANDNEYFNEGCQIVARGNDTYGDGFNKGRLCRKICLSAVNIIFGICISELF